MKKDVERGRGHPVILFASHSKAWICHRLTCWIIQVIVIVTVARTHRLEVCRFPTPAREREIFPFVRGTLKNFGIAKIRIKQAVRCRWYPQSGNSLILAAIGKLQITSGSEVVDVIEWKTMP